MATERQRRPPLADSVLLVMQFLTALTCILGLVAFGPPLGRLEPLVFFAGVSKILLGFQTVLYFAVLAIVGVFSAGRGIDDTVPGGSPGESIWDHITLSATFGAGAGGAVGAALVLGVPDWLSTTLPLVALATVAVAFVLAGNALPYRGLDTALSAAGATVFAFVLPAALIRPLGGLAVFVAAGVGMPALLAVRWRLRTADPIDRRFSVPVVVVLLLVGGGAIAHDLAGPRPTVSLDTESTVNLSTPDERWYAVSDHAEKEELVRLGTVTARNEFDFARTARLPNYDACLYAGSSGSGPAGRASAVVVAGRSTASPVDDPRLAGGETRAYPIVLLLESVDGVSTDEVRSLGSVPVRRADACPASTDGPAVVIVSTDNGP
ncbi:hypothetical protein [Halorientalis salina]|uniref:hypothetical protein n=1 Tax=Halorientalis salina TaxID=2932266 RepID=UPI0010ABBA49|nr:hypothetical protein [Halorientalis salina]